MDTKWKKCKRGIIKGLCVFLSLVCVGTAVTCALNIWEFAQRAGYFYGMENFSDAARNTLYDPRISSDFLREVGFSYYAIKRNLITYRNGTVFEGDTAESYLESMRVKEENALFEDYVAQPREMAKAYNWLKQNREKEEETTTFAATEQEISEGVTAVGVHQMPGDYEYYQFGYLTIEEFEGDPGYIIDEYGFVSVNEDYYRDMAKQNALDNRRFDLERYENEYKHLRSYLTKLKSLEYFVVNNSTGETFTNSGYRTAAEFTSAYEADTWFVSSNDNFGTMTAGPVFEQFSSVTTPGNSSGFSYLADVSDIVQTKEGIILTPSAYTYNFFTNIRYGYLRYKELASHKYVVGSTNLFTPDPFTVYLSFDYSRSDDADPFSQVYSRYIASVSRLEKSVTVGLVAFALALILLAVFFLISGKGFKGAAAKLRVQDKIPGEIHFIVSAAAFAGLFLAALVLAIKITDFFEWRAFITVGCVALSLAGYAFLLNYVASFNRRRLNKTLFDNLLLLWPIKLLRRIYRRLARNSTHLKDGVRRYFRFFVPFYVVISIVCWLFLLDDSPLVIIGIIGLVLVNTALLVIVYSYAKSLDKIRETVSQAQQGNFDVEFDCASMPVPMVKLSHEIEDMRCGMKQAIEAAVKDQRTKTELITNVSHDLKTPLTSIITYTDLIQRSSIEDEKVRGYAEILAEKSQRLKQLVEDLTEAAKVSTGAVDIQLADVDLGELVMQAVGENEEVLARRGIDVRFTPVSGNPVVRADGQKTYRVIENIISNINKYALENTVAYVMVGVQDGFATATFKNISAEQINVSSEQLMERFVRGDVSRSGEGSGLGLSIARDLCTLQGGKFEIYVDGDMFTSKVSLPLAQTEK